MSYLEEFKEKNIDMGFNAAMGIVVLELEDDYSKVRIPIKDWEQNPINAVHGGIIFALGDVVGALATWKMGKMVTTQSCHISFLNAAINATDLIGEGRPLHLGKRTYVVDVEIRDTKGTLISKMTNEYHAMNREIV